MQSYQRSTRIENQFSGGFTSSEEYKLYLAIVNEKFGIEDNPQWIKRQIKERGCLKRW